tara:strand:- start:805 stop:1029 length:225 start_codon:yes stop_codon:yes gene_type:complete
MFNNSKVAYFMGRLSVNAVVFLVGYRLWTNKPLTTFDKITFTIGLLGISFMAFLLLESPLERKKRRIEAVGFDY